MKTSPAIRVNRLLQAAAGVDSQASVQSVLGDALGIQAGSTTPEVLEDAVSRAVADLRDEIREVDALLRASGVPEHLRQEPINSALSVTSPSRIGVPWRGHRDAHLTRWVLVAWNWISFVIQPEEDEITEDLLLELEKELGELMKAATADGVPPALRTFVLRQAKAIQTALWRYKVKGVEPLKDAVRAGIGDLAFEVSKSLNTDEAKTPESGSVLAKCGRLWSKIASATRDIKALHDFYKLVSEHGPQLAQLAHEAQKMLGS